MTLTFPAILYYPASISMYVHMRDFKRDYENRKKYAIFKICCCETKSSIRITFSISVKEQGRVIIKVLLFFLMDRFLIITDNCHKIFFYHLSDRRHTFISAFTTHSVLFNKYYHIKYTHVTTYSSYLQT